jgi:hypothetical protein
MDKCRSCGAKVFWVITQKNKRMPVDPEPVENGNLEIHDQGQYRPPLAIYVSVKPPGVLRHISHFVTCPNAKAHRKKETRIANPVLRLDT